MFRRKRGTNASRGDKVLTIQQEWFFQRFNEFPTQPFGGRPRYLPNRFVNHDELIPPKPDQMIALIDN